MRALDTFHDNICDSERGDVFTFKNGIWHVEYVREKTLNNGGIEIDAPVFFESDELEILPDCESAALNAE